MAGTVTDESGAVLPGVTLTAVLGTTKETRTAVTDSVGRFRFNSMPVGVYTVQAELSGFGTVKIENYKLSIGQSAILDVKMKIAAVETEITVAASRRSSTPRNPICRGRSTRSRSRSCR